MFEDPKKTFALVCKVTVIVFLGYRCFSLRQLHLFYSTILLEIHIPEIV